MVIPIQPRYLVRVFHALDLVSEERQATRRGAERAIRRLIRDYGPPMDGYTPRVRDLATEGEPPSPFVEAAALERKGS